MRNPILYGVKVKVMDCMGLTRTEVDTLQKGQVLNAFIAAGVFLCCATLGLQN